MKKPIVYLFTILCVHLGLNANGIIRLSSRPYSTADQAAPSVQIIETENGIDVSYDFNYVTYNVVDSDANYVLWEIPGFTNDGTVGSPELPYRSDSFVLPDNYSPKVEITAIEYVELPFMVAPATEPQTESSGQPTSLRPKIKPYEGFFPISNAFVESIQTYRDRPIVYVKVAPIQYNYTLGIVRICKSLRYHIEYASEPHPVTTVVSAPVKHYVQNDDPFLSSYAYNWKNEISNLTKATSLGNLNLESSSVDDYLIITTPRFLTETQNFAIWKKKFGFNVYIENSNSWTVGSVMQKVKEYWAQKPNLRYLLIVGDYEDVPAYTVKSSYDGSALPNDMYYACMDGTTDIIPDIYYGRIPVSTPTEANTVFNKIINYEKNPTNYRKFYHNGLHCAFFQSDYSPYTRESRRFALTSEEVLNKAEEKGFSIDRCYYANSNANPLYWKEDRINVAVANGLIAQFNLGDTIPQSLRKPTFGWNTTSNDIIKSVNSGRLYVLYRGHGSITSWGSLGFKNTHIDLLSNGYYQPIVFSLTCLTGKFDSSYDSFAEAFLKKESGGCVNIIAASNTSWSGYNDALTLGLFKSIWNEPFNSKIELDLINRPSYSNVIGIMLQQALAQVRNAYGINGSKTEETHRLFHCFGDPSMQMYTSAPSNLSISPTISTVTQNGESFLKFSVPSNYNACVYDKSTDQTRIFAGQVSYKYSNISDISICFKTPNQRPYIWEGENVSDITRKSAQIRNNEDYIDLSDDVSYKVIGDILYIGNTDETTIVNIYNISGTLMLNVSGSNCQSIDIGSLDKGFYLIHIYHKDVESIIKLKL